MSFLHRRTHPEDVPGCWACRVGLPQVSADATPSRRPEAAASRQKARQLDADMPAYKRLRRNGVQPPRIEGSAELERKANTVADIETPTR